MCGGVQISKQYTEKGQTLRIYFPNPKAALPVRIDGSVEWIPWGRRREQPGKGPAGGWARTDSIIEGKWEKYQPTEAVVPVEAFMEKDAERVSHWFQAETEEIELQALVIGEGDNRKVYIITSQPPEQYAWVHDRWPTTPQRAVKWSERGNG